MATFDGADDIESVSLLNNAYDEAHNTGNDEAVIDITGEEDLPDTNCYPVLPEGKDYHLFFAYSSDDSAFVRQRVKCLESPPHNLKCCFSDRDFLPGKPIHENIESLMPRCMKIVLVLSPSFYESGWCQMEERLAHAFSATSGLGVIPLVHKPCQVPDSLKTLNYIDETREEEADNKIVEAVLAPAGPSNVLPNWFNPRTDVNGCGVWLPASQESRCGYNWIFHEITEADIDVLRDIGANVHVEDLGHLIDEVNNRWALTCYGFLPCSRHACGKCCCLGFLLFAFLQLIISSITMYVGLRLFTSAMIGLCCSAAILPEMILICCGSKRLYIRQAERKINRALREKNRVLFRKCKVIASVRVDPVPKLAVAYYNTQRCKDFIKELLRNNGDEKRVVEVSQDELEARADAIMESLVDRHAPKFARWEEIQTANFLRHRTKQDKLCLCQLYEASLNQFNLKHQL